MLQNHVAAYLRARTPKVLFTASTAGKPKPHQNRNDKQKGYRNGTPDLFILERRGGFGCLLLELKQPHGRASAAQYDFQAWARARGYKCEIVYGYEAAIACIEEYLHLPPNETPAHQ